MRILILNQFFYPDHSATSQLMTDLAEGLIDRGFDVTALASRGRYNGGAKLPHRESHRGVKIERAWATSLGKGNLACRLCDYLSFYIGAAVKLLLLPRHDIVMALTTPPLIGMVAVVICRLKRAALISLVQDVYPDVAIALGALHREGLLSRLLEGLNRRMLTSSTRIIVLGECMRDRIAAKVGPVTSHRIDVIHNWADGSVIKPLEASKNSFVAQNGYQDRFLVMFSGNLGQVNDFQTLIESAALLRDRADILLVFIGEGAKKDEIADFARRNNLTNVRMLPYQPRELLPQSLAAGHACVVTLAEGLAGLSVPSKAYAIMAAGRPILFVGDSASAIAKIVEEARAGAVVSSGDSRRVSQLITNWADNRAEVELLGGNARAVFEKRFDRRIAIDAYVESFSKCTGRAALPRPGAHPAGRLVSARHEAADPRELSAD
jgi:colanic acid biosynthesis glycosyl transferase WcaI